MHRAAQWWLVITSPFGDTKLPEQPPAMRTAESRTCSSHSSLGAKPCSLPRRSEGKSLSSHIPSSVVRGCGAACVPASLRASAATARPAGLAGGRGGGGGGISGASPHDAASDAAKRKIQLRERKRAWFSP